MFNYRHELKNDQLDLGMSFVTGPMTIGAWYRGIPFKQYRSGLGNSESVALLLGFQVPNQKIKIGYSFDFTISSLQINNTKGAHEVSLSYEIASKKQRLEKKGTVIHPKF